MKEAFVAFYLEGREFKPLRRYLPDPEEISAKILTGTDVRTAITDACREAVKPLETDRKKKKTWVADATDEIGFARAELPSSLPAGVATAEDYAWHCYLAGLADELAYVIEEDVLHELSDEEEDEEEEADDEEEGDDEEEVEDQRGKDP